MVPTEYFVSAMRKHWTKNLGNHSSSELEQVWTTMADTYGQVLSGKTDGRWQLVNPETGTGKTEGSCLYLGYLGWYALHKNKQGAAPGAIFVARTIEQCEEAVTKINGHAGEVVAITRHSKNDINLTECMFKPILVITHEAFVRSVEKVGDKIVGVWQTISHWAGGPRKLTLIDESLTNVVEHHIIKANDLHRLMGAIPHYIKNSYPKEDGILWDLANIIRESKKARLEGREVYLRWKAKEYPLPDNLNWDKLREDLIAVSKSRKGNKDLVTSQLKSNLDTLRSIEGITNSWCYMSLAGGEDSLTSSRFKIPDDVPGPVVLDATASQDVVSYLLGGSRVNLVTMPRSRSYRNVNLHVARTERGKPGVGKYDMKDNRSVRTSALMRTIYNKNKVGDKWLVVCHKDVQPIIEREVPKGIHISTEHWGNIDGKNNWNDHNHVVIFGLSYRDEVWSNNSILSLKKDVDEDTLKTALSSEHRHILHWRVLSADIIQAVNRIRCRKVIDVEGNCPPADVWIILPPDDRGDYILEALKGEMPDINVIEWSYNLDKGEVATGEIVIGPENFTNAFITYLVNASPAEYDVGTLVKRLNFDADTIEKLRKHLKDPKSALRTRLTSLGMSVLVKGKGRGARTSIFRPYELSRQAA